MGFCRPHFVQALLRQSPSSLQTSSSSSFTTTILCTPQSSSSSSLFIRAATTRSSGFAKRLFTTAYSGEPGDGRLLLSEKAPYVPFRTKLRIPLHNINKETLAAASKSTNTSSTTSSKNNNGDDCFVTVEVGPLEDKEIPVARALMNLIIDEGKSWPFVDDFSTDEAFAGYFLSHTALRVIAVVDENDSDDDSYSNGNKQLIRSLIAESPYQNLMGMFYIKPNYPGRCSHICNGGFITAPAFRRCGVARLMGQTFLQVARDLGPYQSSYFNLVFQSNQASVELWESLGFERVAVLPEAADLKGVPGLDTAYGYRYDLTKLPDNYLWDNVSIVSNHDDDDDAKC